jgi:hypothetical protein
VGRSSCAESAGKGDFHHERHEKTVVFGKS